MNIIASPKYNIIHHGHGKEQTEIYNTIINSGPLKIFHYY